MDWYYVKNGDKRGPVSAETIRELAYQGVLQEHDLVWRPGLEEWIRADQAEGVLAPPQIPTSRESTGLEKGRRKSTQNEPVSRPAQEDSGGTSRRQQQPTRVVESEKAAPPQTPVNRGQEPKRGETWLWFYTNIVLPTILILTVIGTAVEAASGSHLPLIVGRLVMFLLTAVLLLGMNQRERWAWESNFLFLFFVALLAAMVSTARAGEGFPYFLGGFIGALLLIFLPNVLYFRKRRHMYSKTERNHFVILMLFLMLFDSLLLYLVLFTSSLT